MAPESVNFNYKMEFSPVEDNHWVARVPNFGITVHGVTREEAEEKARAAVRRLGDLLQDRYGFDGTVEFLKARGVEYRPSESNIVEAQGTFVGAW